MRPVLRITRTLTALLLGALLVFLLLVISNKGKGPLGQMLSRIGEAVRSAEQRSLVDKRSEARRQTLKWLHGGLTSLRNPEMLLTGAFDNTALNSLKPLFDLEDSLQTTFALIHLYTAWGSKEDQQFPALQVEGILSSGSLPLITWEPWLTDFDAEKITGLRPVETRDKGGLHDIAGGLYDTYLRAWAQAAAKTERPIFLRFGHEMNDPYRYPWGPQNNPANDFIEAWRHVHQLFRAEGAENVLWVWSPHPAYGWFDAYFPGAEYVDWVSVGALNYGTVATWSQWWAFDEIFGKHYETLAAFGKPILISEFGSLAVGGDRAAWYAEALEALPQRYPQLKGLLFFHYNDDRTTTQQALDWSLVHDPECIQAIAKAMAAW